LLLHLVENNTDIKFVIFVVVLPKKGKIVWKSNLEKIDSLQEIETLLKNGDYYQAFIGCWKKLKSEIDERNIDCRLLVITEQYRKEFTIEVS